MILLASLCVVLFAALVFCCERIKMYRQALDEVCEELLGMYAANNQLMRALFLRKEKDEADWWKE